jgi:hypothetical protein
VQCYEVQRVTCVGALYYVKTLLSLGLPQFGVVQFGGTFLQTPNLNQVQFRPSGQTANSIGSSAVQVRFRVFPDLDLDQTLNPKYQPK